ncbi:hypothetical protein E2986_12372 [Frieseomelitta varia]|uniref:Uncharacterized protein n=1 Tax=Frieseomelitta varia TaxID=561572 RepID=A0A833RE46_9HYME|nr:hypothetical protein E2986_12372 [Frieseomelitta varia]
MEGVTCQSMAPVGNVTISDFIRKEHFEKERNSVCKFIKGLSNSIRCREKRKDERRFCDAEELLKSQRNDSLRSKLKYRALRLRCKVLDCRTLKNQTIVIEKCRVVAKKSLVPTFTFQSIPRGNNDTEQLFKEPPASYPPAMDTEDPKFWSKRDDFEVLERDSMPGRGPTLSNGGTLYHQPLHQSPTPDRRVPTPTVRARYFREEDIDGMYK